MSSSACPVCGHDALEAILHVPSVPVFCNVLHPDRGSAMSAPRGDIALAACPRCAMITNTAFDPGLVAYSADYENSLHFSGAFQRYARGLARRLVETYGIRGRTVVEVGSGKGDFLAMLCDAGDNRGVGYDPSYSGEAADLAGAERIRFYPVLYGDQHPADAALVCSRHVLEHVEDPRALVQRLGASLTGRDTVVYTEVPDAGYMLREAAIYDVIYEHRSYFAAPALGRLFRDAGFRELDIATAFGGQFLTAEHRWAGDVSPVEAAAEVEELAKLAGRFGDVFRERTTVWSRRLADLAGAGREVVLWGAGSKGVTFLNVVDGAETVTRVVDVNPRKAGRHVPGGGQEVVSPDSLTASPPDVVVVMNPVYEDEIRRDLADRGIVADVVGV